MKKIVYLDFDGTVVDFGFPGVGAENPRWKVGVNKLRNAGWEIIINTARCITEKQGTMRPVHEFFAMAFPGEEMRYTNVKVGPEDWLPHPKKKILYIDDLARGIPTLERHGRPIVHWKYVIRDLKKHNLC